jgi:hypothetical protein
MNRTALVCAALAAALTAAAFSLNPSVFVPQPSPAR